MLRNCTISAFHVLMCSIGVLLLVEVGSAQGEPTPTAQPITSPGEPPQCIEAVSKVEHVPYGWPLQINCGFTEVDDIIYDEYPSGNEEIYEDPFLQCVVMEVRTGVVVHNETVLATDDGEVPTHDENFSYFISNLTEATATLYEIVVTNVATGRCVAQRLRINATQFRQASCAEAEQSSASHPMPTRFGRRKLLECGVSDIGQGIAFARPDLSVVWYRNCSEDGVVTNLTRPTHYELEIYSANFEHAGVYTCAIRHNGMIRFFKTYPVCIAYIRVPTPVATTCLSPQVYASVGESVELKCRATVGSGYVSPILIQSEWKMLPEIDGEYPVRCKNQRNGQNFPRGEENGRRYCLRSAEDETCFLHVATKEEQISTPHVVNVTFVINNVRASDFGRYRLTVTLPDPHDNKTEGSVSLLPSFDRRPLWAVYVALGSLAAFLVIFAVAFYFRLYLIVYYRRKFGRVEKGGDFTYDVVMSYNSRQEGEESTKMVRDMVTDAEKALRGRGFTRVFHEQRDAERGANREQTLKDAIRASHRVAILIPCNLEGYVKDDGDFHYIQSGMDASFEEQKSTKKCIFILGPGISQTIKRYASKAYRNTNSQHSPDVHVCHCLSCRCDFIRRMMITWDEGLDKSFRCGSQVCSHVTWKPDKLNRTRFNFEVEYFMPNVRGCSTGDADVEMQAHNAI